MKLRGCMLPRQRDSLADAYPDIRCAVRQRKGWDQCWLSMSGTNAAHEECGEACYGAAMQIVRDNFANNIFTVADDWYNPGYVQQIAMQNRMQAQMFFCSSVDLNSS